jgi:hypothetical protein
LASVLQVRDCNKTIAKPTEADFSLLYMILALEYNHSFKERSIQIHERALTGKHKTTTTTRPYLKAFQ